jgi:hypothetical protein
MVEMGNKQPETEVEQYQDKGNQADNERESDFGKDIDSEGEREVSSNEVDPEELVSYFKFYFSKYKERSLTVITTYFVRMYIKTFKTTNPNKRAVK